ncbi:MAG: beta-ketoacyl-ACP synthase II [Desulfovibrio sp.]|uniref:beta-ketoacyl-ACP synthase II n=1 Tax=Desulfovibrio sp. TaxID=885 RepID=UPI0039E3228A
MRKVVVTGYGIISPSGNDTETLWKNVSTGTSGVKKLEDPAFAEGAVQIGGKVENFPAEAYMGAKDARKYDLYIQYAYAAAKQAIDMANLSGEGWDAERAGVYVGSGVGGIETIMRNHEAFLTKGSRRVSPFMVPMMISNMAAGVIAIKTGFKGANYAPVSACATANTAIGEAFLSIRHGYADMMLAGGADAGIHPFLFAGFSSMKALSTNNDHPTQASRPFDRDRDGFVMGEGAAVLLLEDIEHAQKRGAKILGEVAGYGATCDAAHITSPDFQGAARAMNIAIKQAGIAPCEIGYVNAHATGTKEGDKSEAKAIREVFRDCLDTVRVSATKSMTGHLFGAAGGIEGIISLLALQHGLLPPTINLDNPDEECALNHICNTAVKSDTTLALSNAFGFGGHNASLVFRKFEG